MSKSNALENDVLLKVFHGVEFSWDANTSLFVSLHSSDPTESGNQSTNEVAYGGYARQSILRTSDGWDVSGNQASNDDLIQFPVCVSGSAVATHVAIGTSLSGAGQILYKGALNSSLVIGVNTAPTFAANAITISEE